MLILSLTVLLCVIVMNCRRILLVSFTSTNISSKKLIVDADVVLATYQDVKDYIRLNLLLTDDFNIEVLNTHRGIYENLLLTSCLRWESGFLPLLVSNLYVNRNEDYNIDSNDRSNNQRLAIKGRLFDINHGLSIRNHTIKINENISSSTAHLGTGLNTWDASIVLAKYLEHNHHFIEDKVVLELGAGTGIAGIAALLLHARFVRLTDLKYALPNLLANVESNVNKSSTVESSFDSCAIASKNEYDKFNDKEGPRVTATATVVKRNNGYAVSELDWSNENTYPRRTYDNTNDGSKEDKLEHYNVVLGADIVWLEHLIPSLIHALKTIMDSNTMFIFSYQTRSKRTDELLFNMLKSDFWIFKLNPMNERSVKGIEGEAEATDICYTSDIISIYHIYKRSTTINTTDFDAILCCNENGNNKYTQLI